MHGLRALVSDVFGTLVDWRSGVARELRTRLPVGAQGAYGLADAWRDEYQPAMEEVRAGRIPSASSTCCTGATWTSCSGASVMPTKPRAPSSTWPGTASTPGRT